MKLPMTPEAYNDAIARLAVLLSKPSKPGSPEDIETMELARFVEDYEVANAGTPFEPTYIREND